MKKNRNFYSKNQQRIWGIVITLFVVGLALYGSWQYYVAALTQEHPWYLASATLYSTLKLFTFNPTVSGKELAPPCYEAAKWLAPLCTGYWAIHLLISLFRKSFCMVKRVFCRRRQILVFGYHEKSAVFLNHLISEKAGVRDITLIVDQPLDKETRTQLERSNVLILQMDVPGANGALRSQDLKRLRLARTAELVLFEAEQTRNFMILNLLLEAVSREEKPVWGQLEGSIHCAVWCEDKTIQKLIIDYYDTYQGRKPFDLHLFSMPEIAADALFRQHPLYENCLSWAARQPGSFADENFAAHIPLPHVLIVGFGRYGQAVFERTLLTGMLSDRSEVPDYRQLQITIIDQNIKECRNLLEKRYPGIDKICKVNCIEENAGSLHVINELSKLPCITYGVISLSDQECAIDIMELLKRFLSPDWPGAQKANRLDMDIPIAIRAKNDDTIIRHYNVRRRAAGSQIIAFGTDQSILSYDNLIQPGLETSARTFNALYEQIAGHKEDIVLSDEIIQSYWNGRSFEHKESSRAHALNVPYFQALLGKLPPLPPKAEMLRQKGGTEEEQTEEFMRKLDGQPVLERLAALEHMRWCAFCYANGYLGCCDDPADKGKERWIYREDKEEYFFGKVHPCLIEDWQKFCRLPHTRRTIIYDVCGIYSYAESDTE